MKISVYKADGGEFSVLVEAAIGHGKPPVLLPGVTRESLRERLGPVLEHQKGKKTQQQGLVP